jgi:hypothetical protein
MSLANFELLSSAAWCIRFAVREMSVASDDEADSRQRVIKRDERILVGLRVPKFWA